MLQFKIATRLHQIVCSPNRVASLSYELIFRKHAGNVTRLAALVKKKQCSFPRALASIGLFDKTGTAQICQQFLTSDKAVIRTGRIRRALYDTVLRIELHIIRDAA